MMIDRARCVESLFRTLALGVESHRAPLYVSAAFVLIAPEKETAREQRAALTFAVHYALYNFV